MYATRDYAVVGGLVSHDASPIDLYRQVGIYAGRILKRRSPPIYRCQATKFEFVRNLKTAKTLGLEVPDRFLVAADEVIK
jgi:ABC-type uncharacterized transport system substrate-binding protein